MAARRGAGQPPLSWCSRHVATRSAARRQFGDVAQIQQGEWLRRTHLRRWPGSDVTPRVLDLLDRYGAKASFFCIGRRATAYPDIVRDIVRRGHSVENHSHRHPHCFAFYLPHALKREIDDAQAAMQSITGIRPRFFRAPMGLRGPALDPVVVRSALIYVSWTRRGWDCVSRSPAMVLRRITSRLAAGDVILLHDGSCATDAWWRAGRAGGTSATARSSREPAAAAGFVAHRTRHVTIASAFRADHAIPIRARWISGGTYFCPRDPADPAAGRVRSGAS